MSTLLITATRLLAAIRKAVSGFLVRIIGYVQAAYRYSDSLIITVLAIAVGLLSGVGATLFHLAMEHTGSILRWLFTVGGAGPLSWAACLIPAVGALVAVGFIYLFARNDHSHGTSAIIESVALRGGRLPGAALLTKVAAAAVFIGAGGSAGPEDPSVQVGGVAGSYIGKIFRMSEERNRMLVASGVAAAVAAAFNAPIAGVFFALEVVVGELSASLFAPVVLAAVAGSAISRWLNGNHPAFVVPAYDLNSALYELPMYAVLGFICALVGVAFIRLLFGTEDFLHRIKLPKIGRALLAGLAVGSVGLLLPQILGVGYSTVGTILAGQLTGATEAGLLLVAKLLLTALCIAAVGVGGTFAPSLFLGATTGLLVGMVAHAIFPGSPAAAYALVGMGGVLTAVVRAPITAVLLLFEITNDYRIILPIMLCVAVSNLVANLFFPESVYTERLARNGIRLRFGRDQNILERITVRDAMSRSFESISPAMAISDALAIIVERRYDALLVAEGPDLKGIITRSDISRALEAGAEGENLVYDVMSTRLTVAMPDMTLHDAMPLFAARDIRQIPVVERHTPTRVIGLLRRSDIMRSYNARIAEKTERG